MERQFGNYTLRERIGIGGMGEVYRAIKNGPDGFKVEVAIKEILPDLSREEEFRTRFSREAKLAAKLSHPNIVKVNGFDVIDDRPFIEMEYLPGADLRRILRLSPRGGGLSLDESLWIIHCVARALQHAHNFQDDEKNDGSIIHCDLNPHNILISAMGEVKVTDFGIARALFGGSATDATVRGKLAYMSPEQIRGGPLDQRTDLFSLGIIAYQLLSGVHPFERGSEGATVTAIENAQFRPLESAVPGLPDELCKLVSQLLDLDPTLRPESADLVLETLEPFLKPSAVSRLSQRISSLATEIETPAGTGSSTALTLPRKRLARLWPYLAAGVAGTAFAAIGFILPTGLEQGQTANSPLQEGSGTNTVSEVTLEAEQPALSSTVIIRSYPEGAQILAEGELIGTAPVEISTDVAGSAPALEARLYGYEATKFSYPAGIKGPYVVSLAPLPTGTVQIGAKPWARVSYRGEDMGETPLSIPEVPVGRHTFTLSYDPAGEVRRVIVDVVEGLNPVSVVMGEGR